MMPLPAEVWLEILSNFENNGYLDYSLFANLCLVSKQLCNIAQPFLFNKIDQYRLAYPALCNALCCNPSSQRLGRMVREVNLLSMLELKALTGTIRWEDIELDVARRRNEVAMKQILAVLAMCPNLVKLGCHFECNDSEAYIGNLAVAKCHFVPSRQDLLSLPCINSLRQLYIAQGDYSDGLDLRAFGHLVSAAPLLDTLRLWSVDPFSILGNLIERVKADPAFQCNLNRLFCYQEDSPICTLQPALDCLSHILRQLPSVASLTLDLYVYESSRAEQVLQEVWPDSWTAPSLLSLHRTSRCEKDFWLDLQSIIGAFPALQFLSMYLRLADIRIPSHSPSWACNHLKHLKLRINAEDLFVAATSALAEYIKSPSSRSMFPQLERCTFVVYPIHEAKLKEKVTKAAHEIGSVGQAHVEIAVEFSDDDGFWRI